MRAWNLAPGDPLFLTLAADFRLCTPDYGNDHIWEMELGGGDPSAVALRTTFGLRARLMRLFPRFQVAGQTVCDPAEFASHPTVHSFAPNFLLVSYAPFPGLQVTAEAWVPDSHTLAGRLTAANLSGEPLSLLLEFCGQLIPLEGTPLKADKLQSVNVLSGRCAGLSPVVFLTGGPQPAQGPYPALALDLALAAGSVRTLTWVQASLASPEASFDHARRTAARPWEAERARLELVNAAQTVEVETGDPDWDAAFALSQKAAFGLFFPAGDHLPAPSFVLARGPDHGFSARGDGSDYAHLWNGQPALESLHLAGVLPGAPRLSAGLVRNFLKAQAEDGSIDWKPGLAGQRSRWLSAPLLAGLAYDACLRSGDRDFLTEVFPKLEKFLPHWLDPAHDRDLDGFPEWDTLAQSGLEDFPLFSPWIPGGQGGEIACVETPALAAMLCRDLHALARMAEELDLSEKATQMDGMSAALSARVEECWEGRLALYRLRDRDSHLSLAGKKLASLKGAGTLEVGREFPHPTRLLVQLDLKGVGRSQVQVALKGLLAAGGESERLERLDFQWNALRGVASTHGLFTRLDSLEALGLEKNDRVDLRVMDFSGEEIGLFLPLWAHIPGGERAKAILSRALAQEGRFWGAFGIPSAAASRGVISPESRAVHLPWNALIGEGLADYGFRAEAAQLTARLMGAVIANLKNQRAFYQTYDADTGAGGGERNALQGLAPLRLFLKTLGVEFRPPDRVVLSGKNPFPWSVTVKYRGFIVTRQAEQTIVVFPGGGSIMLDDPTDAVVSPE